MGVPTALAQYPVALHGPVAADYVLEDASKDVVDAGTAVGRGRALIHHEKGSVGAFGLGASEDVLFFPMLQDFCVQFWETDAVGNGIKHVGDRSSRPASVSRIGY